MVSRDKLRVAADACCFLSIITGKGDAQTCVSLLDGAWDGSFQLVESPAILVEVLPRHPWDGGSGKRQTILAMLESEHIEYVDLTNMTARLAADLSTHYSHIHGMDAVHLATAIKGGADFFVTQNIHDFPMGERVQGVEIVTPETAVERLYGEPELPFD